jgi:hypothetical protein
MKQAEKNLKKLWQVLLRSGLVNACDAAVWYEKHRGLLQKDPQTPVAGLDLSVGDIPGDLAQSSLTYEP